MYVFLKLKNEQFAHSLVFKERYEQITQVAHDKRATVSELLTKNERLCANLSACPSKMSDYEQIAQVAHQK